MYPVIEDHGLIGHLQSSASVEADGTLDWSCAPRFDSPSRNGRGGARCRGPRRAVVSPGATAGGMPTVG